MHKEMTTLSQHSHTTFNGCKGELLITLVFSRMPALLPLPLTAPSTSSMSVRRSLHSGLNASMLSNRSHVSSGGHLINCLAGAKLLCHLTLMRLASTSSSTTKLLRAMMNLGSLQPRSVVSSVTPVIQTEITSSVCLTLCYSRTASTCLRRSCACCSVGLLSTVLFCRM